MPRRKIRAHYEHMSEFETGRAIGLKEAGWYNRLIARHLCRSGVAIRQCWQKWVNNVMNTTSGRQWSTKSNNRTGGQRNCQNGCRSTRIHVIYHPTCDRHTSVQNDHQQWCREQSTLNCAYWGRIVFSDESRFLLCPDDRRKRVWRRPGQRVDPGLTVEHHTGPQQGVMVWGAISFDSKTPLVDIPGTLKHNGASIYLSKPITIRVAVYCKKYKLKRVGLTKVGLNKSSSIPRGVTYTGERRDVFTVVQRLRPWTRGACVRQGQRSDARFCKGSYLFRSSGQCFSQSVLTLSLSIRSGGEVVCGTTKAMVAVLQKIDMDPEQHLYTPKIEDIPVIEMHGDILRFFIGYDNNSTPHVYFHVNNGIFLLAHLDEVTRHRIPIVEVKIIRNIDIKVMRQTFTSLSMPTNVPDYPWQTVSLDIFYIQKKPHLLVVDRYSGYPEVFTLDPPTASNVKNKLRETFARFGIPETMMSDNGPPFRSEIMTDFCIRWGIHQKMTYRHPHSYVYRGAFDVRSPELHRYIDPIKLIGEV
ncbi:K02A2.6-like [Cordylochernes scorpioides]|uniref:K02A2.6-like n=1 Tax=Cordylochernes scorpioides TaxID=51811 RepID=A0ABY6K2V2_9ARAC|nr:K02A2.6-like [Cordylochernes scorpioides]